MNIGSKEQLKEEKKAVSSGPKDHLMTRLVTGQKAKVEPQAMKKLTNKNYKNLPEIKQKEAESKRKQEELQKKQRIAAM